MTQEEKVKAYDEAIGRLEDIKTGKCQKTFMFTEGLFDYIFPELKESKDEMIRGKIIATIHLYYGEPLEDEAKEMIAWLEKQCEQKTTIEMKSAEESLGIDSDTYNNIVDDCVYGEQKPAEWHREDEQNLNACLGYIPDEFLRRWLMDVIHAKYDKPVDKVEQKPIDANLKDVVDKEANAIWKEINTGGSYSVIDSFNQFYGICMQVAEAVVDCKKPTEWIQELGLKARTDKELVEEVYSHIDSIKDTADRMTSGNFMHNRAAIKFSANTIAKVLELMGLKAQKGEEV